MKGLFSWMEVEDGIAINLDVVIWHLQEITMGFFFVLQWISDFQ